jgi:hypothetical protein
VEPLCVDDAELVEPPPCNCTRNACRSLVSCWNSAVVPEAVELLPLELDAEPVSPDKLAASESVVVAAAALVSLYRLVAYRLDWVMLEIDTRFSP